MFEKNMKISYLLDFYGDVLDERVRAVMDAYYDDDLSLSEVAEGEGISRQGVRHLIKKGEEHLLFLEQKLGLAQRHMEIQGMTEELFMLARQLEAEKINPAEAAQRINDVTSRMVSKGV